jgi:alcohol dehydrogenase class IV
MSFSILQPGKILFGRGQAAEAAGIAASFGRGVALVHGRDAGRAEWLRQDLRQAGMAVRAISCGQEPTLAMLEAAVEAARGVDLVISLGGGAAVDLGKAVAALVPAPGGAMDHLEVVGKGLPLSAPPLPFVAVPTTAGTGAEVTKNAVIDVPAHRRKVSLRDDRMIARVAIVDPALTDNAPRGVTLVSGLDALVQVVEPWLCTRANAYTDSLCRPAMAEGIAALRALMAGEDPKARDAMAWVSLCGGLALANSGLGAVHGLAGVIGGMTGAAHGAICGALLPHILRANAAAPRMAEVLRALGPVDALEDWIHGAGLPRLSALGLNPADHRAVAEAALSASSMKANPVPLDARDLEAILGAAG